MLTHSDNTTRARKGLITGGFALLRTYAVVVPGLVAGLGMRADAPSDPGIPVAGLTNEGASNAIGLPVEDVAPDNQPATKPWWRTNQPPSELMEGAQLGTDAVGPSPKAMPDVGSGKHWDVPPALQWGPVTAHPSLGYGVTYGTGLLSGPGRKETTAIQTVSPGLALDLGSVWTLDYSPRLVFYESKAFRDTVNQFASIHGSGNSYGWDWSAMNRFADIDSPLIETGQQTKRTLDVTRLDASREITPKISIDLDLSQTFRWTESFNDVYSWATADSIHYQLRPHMSLGLVAGLGYDLIDPGTDMVSERLSGIVRGGIGEKISYNISGGVEFRQFVDSDRSVLTSPIADAAIHYQATSTTRLGIHFGKMLTPSFFSGRVSDTTSIDGSISQRLFGRFHLDLTGGHRTTDFLSTASRNLASETVTYEFVRLGLEARFLKHGSVAIFFKLGDNNATQQALSFSSRQIGFHVSYGF